VRILLSCAFNPAFEALPEYLASALRSLGHEVALFDHRAFLLPGRVRATSAALERWDRRRLSRRLVQVARRFRPDQLIVNQGMTIEPAAVRALRADGVRCVDWFSDFPAQYEEGLLAAPAYDAFHLGSSWAAGRHRARGHAHAAWLPFACDPAVHAPITSPPSPRASDRGATGRIVFVGSHYPERQVLLRHLRGLPVDVLGPGWERAAGDPHVAPMVRGGALRPARWRALYAGAAAVLNIHYGAFGPVSASGDMANTRVFEILGCGAPQIVDRQRDVLRLFREDVHLFAFDGGAELRARVEEVLADPAKARRVAEAGRSAVLAAHTYADRARVLLGEARFAGEAGVTAGAAAPAEPVAAAGGGRA
jgi:spore maturation protein CgeB